VLRPLDEAGVADAATGSGMRQRRGAGAASVMCFLHSYANPAHERRRRAIAGAHLPGWFVCASHERACPSSGNTALQHERC